MDLKSEKYDEGMSLYLEKLRVNEIDKEYNAAVNAFETQMQEQEIAAKLGANLASSISADRATEAQPGLGTGAAAVASAGMQKALGNVHQTIETQAAEAYQEGVAQIAKDYQTELESVLGEYDEATGTFAGLTEYQDMANMSTDALMKTLAMAINENVNTASLMGDEDNPGYIKVLEEAGLIESRLGNEVILSARGKEYLDYVVNNVTPNEQNPALGNRTFMDVMAEQMAISKYSIDGITSWSDLDEFKQAEITKKYKSWLFNNQDNLRVTSWDLYTKTESGIELDTRYDTPIPQALGLIHSGDGVPAGKSVFTIEVTDEFIVAETKEQKHFDQIKADILSGKIADGAYITFASGKANDNDKFYYVYKGHIYETEYTMASPPSKIDLKSANVYSFGNYQDTGKGEFLQDDWVNEIIRSAKAGTIPDSTYIRMNYGSGDAEKGWYLYNDGVFELVPGNTKVAGNYLFDYGNTHSDKVIAVDMWRTHYGGTDKYLDW